jgi:type I restriction-modification system DNA methylase subunit
MLYTKFNSCGNCNTPRDQLEMQKHKDKRELFEFKLSKFSSADLQQIKQVKQMNQVKHVPKIGELNEKCNIKNQDILGENEIILYNNSSQKKLKLSSYDNTENTTDTLNTLKNAMIEESNCVSNKDALRDKIHEIHNYLRNNGAGYGMNALKVFNILYGLKKIEENNLLDKVSLARPVCEFSHLLELANNNEDELLVNLIRHEILDSIHDSELKDLLFYEIPKNIKGSVFAHLIKEIDKITLIEKTCNVLLSGKIYEYFVGRDESAISELGAYFTDRHIVDYILQKLDPSTGDDGSIPSMIDMFGGSGGFTTGYINYLNDKYPQTIPWETEINKISHFDANEDVIKSAGLEFFCLTGVLPNMDNLKYKNSFTDEFNGKKYKYPLTNPPYGGDKNNKTETQSKREKVKEYIKHELTTITDEELRVRRQKQLKYIETKEKQEKKESDKTKVCVSACSARIQKFAKDYGLKGNDKESCSLMLLMDILEVGGTAIGVLKEGVFFNKTYKDLRKCLVENFRVREVISVPADQFENTSTKTSIVIFDNAENGEKTVEVKFSDLTVEKYEHDKFEEVFGDIVIVENKGDICGVSDKLVSVASREEILGNAICSLNGKDYNKKEIIVGEGYELVKLGDICEFLPKSKRNASFGQATGICNFYTSSDKVQRCDVVDYNEECLIIGSGGVANIKIDNSFSCSADNLILKTQHNVYFYNLFKGNMNLLTYGFTGSTLKHLSKDYLKDLKLPIPKSPAKIQEWVDKISAPYNEKNAKQTQIKELETFVQNRIREIGETEECEEVELGSVCEIKSGKAINSENRKGTLYPYYAANGISGYVNDYLFDGKYVVCAQDGSIGATHLVNCKFYASNHVWVLKINNVNSYLIYYILKHNVNYNEITSGSVIPKLTKEKISSIKLKLPKNKQLIQDLEPNFQQIEELQNEVKIAEETYKRLIQELSQEAMPQQTATAVEAKETVVTTAPKKTKKTAKKTELVAEEEKEQETVVTTAPKKTKKTAKKTELVAEEEKKSETAETVAPKKTKKTAKKTEVVAEEEKKSETAEKVAPKKTKKTAKKTELVVEDKE